MKQWWDKDDDDFEENARRATAKLRSAIMVAQGYKITLDKFLPQRERLG